MIWKHQSNANISPEEKEEKKALAKVGRNFHHYELQGVWSEGGDLREAEFYLATSIWLKYLPPEAPKKCADEKKAINHQELSKILSPQEAPKIWWGEENHQPPRAFEGSLSIPPSRGSKERS
jgi:hypothetical protein